VSTRGRPGVGRARSLWYERYRYRLTDPHGRLLGKQAVFSVKRLKRMPALSREAIIDAGLSYEVEKNIPHRYNRATSRRPFRLHYSHLGPDADTWEPASSLNGPALDILDEYLAKRKLPPKNGGPNATNRARLRVKPLECPSLRLTPPQLRWRQDARRHLRSPPSQTTRPRVMRGESAAPLTLWQRAACSVRGGSSGCLCSPILLLFFFFSYINRRYSPFLPCSLVPACALSHCANPGHRVPVPGASCQARPPMGDARTHRPTAIPSRRAAPSPLSIVVVVDRLGALKRPSRR
jgi:hypothetical protein